MIGAGIMEEPIYIYIIGEKENIQIIVKPIRFLLRIEFKIML